MSWQIVSSFRLPDEPEALTYIAAVEAADGQALEPAVRIAINSFVKGCKNDGIWNAIKASCILAGARTLAGALVPLAGAAPTNINFASGDYNRKTGLIGNASSKYIDSGRADNADAQNSAHCFVHVTAADTRNGSATGMIYIGGSNSGNTSRRAIGPYSGELYFTNRSGATANGISSTTGGMGTSRIASTGYNSRRANSNASITVTSVSPGSQTIYVFADNANGTVVSGTNARIAFYSIGEALDLALLDNRVTTLISAFGTAIA